MPLDVAGFPIQVSSLTDVLKSLGIAPIPREVLARHKKSEIKKHPAHWAAPILHLYRDSVAYIGTAFVCSIVAAIVVFTYDLVTWHLLLGTILGPILMFVLPILMLFGMVVLDGIRISVKDKAEWVESKAILRGTDNIPCEIANLGKAILKEQPTAAFVKGTLVQNNVTLDPYLIVKDGADEAVLGIWDDNGILLIAARPAHFR
jgi:hypothetical protein